MTHRYENLQAAALFFSSQTFPVSYESSTAERKLIDKRIYGLTANLIRQGLSL